MNYVCFTKRGQYQNIQRVHTTAALFSQSAWPSRAMTATAQLHHGYTYPLYVHVFRRNKYYSHYVQCISSYRLFVNVHSRYIFSIPIFTLRIFAHLHANAAQTENFYK